MSSAQQIQDIEDFGAEFNTPGFVHSTDSFSCVDGPGIRYLVFAQGCRLRCVFCCQPDTWKLSAGIPMGSADLAHRISKFTPYLRPNGGGVTVTGGEPLVQSRFLAELFKAVKKMGLTTCIDTTGQGDKARDWDVVLPHTDRVLFCLKHMRADRYRQITGAHIEPALDFARELASRGIPYQLRYVLTPGHTDDPEDVDALIAWAARQPTLDFIELLPYHELGKHKWKELGLRFKAPDARPPTKDELQDFVDRCDKASVPVKCARL